MSSRQHARSKVQCKKRQTARLVRHRRGTQNISTPKLKFKKWSNREVRLRNRNNVEKKKIKCVPYSGLANRDQFGLLRASAVNVASTRAHGLS